MAKIINLGYTSSLDNKGIILTGEEGELHATEEEAKDQALLLANEDPSDDPAPIYIWEDTEDKWHVGW